MSGSGPPATSCPYPALPPGPTASTRRSSSATSTRCCAARRSRSARWPAGARSVTGTTRSGGRSSPVSAPPGTPPPRRPAAGGGDPGPMCRHLAYLGPPVTVHELVFGPPAGLARQAWAPRRQRHGTMNVDGFGIGWYADGDPVPARYRRAGPIWADPGAADLARVTRTRALLAAVRSATGGTESGAAAAAPYASGRWLFSHNGVLKGWPAATGDLAASLPAEDLLTLEARCDSALAWALVAARLKAGAPGPAARGSWWRPSPATTSPAGPRYPATACSRRPSTLSRCAPCQERPRRRRARRKEGSPPDDRTARRALPPGGLPGPRPPRGRQGRPDGLAQDPAPQVAVRRERQRALREDHPARRVLPDPRRTVHPGHGGRRDRRCHRRQHAGRAGRGRRGQDPAAARRAARGRHAAQLRPGGRQRDRADRGGPPGAGRLPWPVRPGRRLRLRGASGPAGPLRPTAGGVPRRDHRQPAARAAGGVPRLGQDAAGPRRRVPARHRPG